MLNHLDRESRKSLGDSVVVVIVFVAVMLAFAVSARCETPGLRVTWLEPPDAVEFSRVAGERGFVVALSPERAEHVLATVEDGHADVAECRLELGAQADVVAALRAQVAALETALAEERASLDLEPTTRNERAMLSRPRPWLAFLSGVAVGAGAASLGAGAAR